MAECALTIFNHHFQGFSLPCLYYCNWVFLVGPGLRARQ